MAKWDRFLLIAFIIVFFAAIGAYLKANNEYKNMARLMSILITAKECH